MLSPQPQRKKGHNRSSSNGTNEPDVNNTTGKVLEARGLKQLKEGKIISAEFHSLRKQTRV